MTNALDMFVKASDEVRQLDIPSREAVLALTKSALNMVAIDLANNNVQGAIDTMDKTRAIEEYIKAKVRQEHADLVTQNLVASCRFRIVREVGAWLAEHIQPYRTRSTMPTGVASYFLEDLGISRKSQSYKWQRIASLPEDEFESFIEPYIKPNNGAVSELMWKDVWSLANPKPPTKKDEKIIPESITTAPGKKLYLWLESGKEIVTNYFDHLKSEGGSMTEIFFMVAYLDKTWKNLAAAHKELSKLTRVRDGANQS